MIILPLVWKTRQSNLRLPVRMFEWVFSQHVYITGIAARIGYFKLGVNLKTETPTAVQIRQGVECVLTDLQYKRNGQKLAEEFRQYDANTLCEKYIAPLMEKSPVAFQTVL